MQTIEKAAPIVGICRRGRWRLLLPPRPFKKTAGFRG